MFFGIFPLIFLIVFINAMTRIIRNSASDGQKRISGGGMKQVPSVVRDVEYHEVKAPQETFVRSTRIQSIATDAAAQEKKIPLQSQRLYGVIHSIFGASTMTGQKYLSTVNAAYDKIRANHQVLLRQMQSFDERGYVTLNATIHNGKHREDNIDDGIQMEQLTLYEMQLDQMADVLNQNERIFLFLEKLSMELQGMSSSKENQATMDLLTEIQGLIGDVKYYS